MQSEKQKEKTQTEKTKKNIKKGEKRLEQKTHAISSSKNIFFYSRGYLGGTCQNGTPNTREQPGKMRGKTHAKKQRKRHKNNQIC